MAVGDNSLTVEEITSNQPSEMGVVSEEDLFEKKSFENMVLHHKEALISISAGANTCMSLSKRDREHMRKLGILLLISYQGRRYILSHRARRILGISA